MLKTSSLLVVKPLNPGRGEVVSILKGTSDVSAKFGDIVHFNQSVPYQTYEEAGTTFLLLQETDVTHREPCICTKLMEISVDHA